MKLELTVLEALNLNSAITAAQTRVKGAKLTLGMRLAHNAKKLAEVTSSFDESRTELLKNCAEKDENGGLVEAGEGQVKLTDAKKFNEGLSELLAEKFDLELKPLDAALFPDAVDPDIVGGLYAIIVDEAA